MIICADDYGLSDDINEAIVELCGAGRLVAVSCMVVLKSCDAASMAALLALRKEERGRATLSSVGTTAPHVGLHLTFTHEPLEMEPLPAKPRPGLPSFGELIRRSLLGRLNSEQVSLDIANQYQLFVQKAGRHPDFIDGHLHTHQLPGIRERLIKFVLTLPQQDRPYIRNTAMPLRKLRRRSLPWLKAASIGFLGKRMGTLLKRADLETNDGFAGIYDFNHGERYAQYFPRFSDSLAGRNGILVVHPGKRETWRRREFETLMRSNPI